jgi:hypothetical protein
MAGQKVSEDEDKGSSCRHQGVLELLSCLGVGSMNEVGRRMVSALASKTGNPTIPAVPQIYMPLEDSYAKYCRHAFEATSPGGQVWLISTSGAFTLDLQEAPIILAAFFA